MKILSIIPARGGSKGVPRKNIRVLCGKPLIAYTILEALKSKKIHRTIVSTEDDEIAKISREFGAEVLKRPIKLAQDETPTIDVIFHVIDELKKEKFIPDLVMVLQPTSPLRKVEDIDNALELFLNSNCESVVGVCEAIQLPHWSFIIKNGYMKPLFKQKYLKMRRQEIRKTVIPNGAVFIAAPETLHKYKGFICNKTVPYIMPMDRGIDIDNESDFILAELLIKKN